MTASDLLSEMQFPHTRGNGYHQITAVHGGMEVGWLRWNDGSPSGQHAQGEITALGVAKDYQGHGAATRMYREAGQISPVVHSQARTRAGEGWAGSVGGPMRPLREEGYLADIEPPPVSPVGRVVREALEAGRGASGHHMTRLPGDHRAKRAPGPDSLSAHETLLPAEAAPTPGPQQAGEEPITYHHTEYAGGVHWFSAEHDGEEIAYAHVLENQEPGGRHIEIKKLRTDPHYRRRGIGAQLIEEVANHFPDLEMRLKPYPIDEDGTQTTEDIEEFYAARGFDRYQLRDGDPFELSDYMTKPALSVPPAARERHDVEVGKARREPDKDFVGSHRAEVGCLSPAQEREHRFAAADLLARHGIHVRSDGLLSSEEVDTTPDLDHTIEIHPGQPLYTEQDDLNRDVLAHYRQHGPGVPHPPTWQADHDDPDLPHRPTVVTYRGRHWVTDGLHRTLVARERGQSITAWHVDPERDRREYDQWAARRQRQAASGPAEFPDPVQPAARFSASTGQAAGGHRGRLTRRSGPSRRPARRPAGPGGSQQRRRTGCSGRYRDLREVPATGQAIRADRPRLVLSAARPAGVSGSAPATGTIRMPASREGD